MNDSPLNNGPSSDLTLRILRKYWLYVICLPPLYLLICTIVQEIWFTTAASRGFYPLTPTTKTVTLTLFGTFVVGAQALLLWLKRRFGLRLEEAESDPFEYSRLLKRRFMTQAAVCDSVSGLGVIYFLLEGDLRAMFVFGALSLLLYLQAYPVSNQ